MPTPVAIIPNIKLANVKILPSRIIDDRNCFVMRIKIKHPIAKGTTIQAKVINARVTNNFEHRPPSAE